ncbi:MAG: glycosyltransferase family 2 protein [Oscillospiraceae bacterium]|nr:glycosyltransferase family 2 protein [Oscillospiraceae bacterium]
MPEISIILPAYNAQDTLVRAVESVRAQHFQDWELILVNDGSIDNTAALCDCFAGEDSRIRVLHKENAGVSCARNDGISAARGAWIAFLDADDWYEPDYLSAMLVALHASAEESAACGFSYVYPNGEKSIAPSPLAEGLHTAEEVTQGFVSPLLCDRLSSTLTLGVIWRCLFSRRILLENDIQFSGSYLEDELFLIEYFGRGQSMACVNKPLYNYMQSDSSVTHRYHADFVDTFARTLDAKAALVERFSIPVSPDWRDNSAWAGLLIAVSNLFAPAAPGKLCARIRDTKALCANPVFAHAYETYTPTGMNRNKQIVAALLRRRLFLPLGLLYTVKNRKR